MKDVVVRSILEKFDILVSIEDDSYKAYSKNASVRDRMTFKSWKEEVFGNSGADIYIYGAFDPANQTLFSTVQRDCSAKDIRVVFERIMKEELDNKDQEMQFFPKKMLIDCLSDLQGLESSVSEFFERYTKSAEANINLEELLRGLISTFNDAARNFRQLAGK